MIKFNQYIAEAVGSYFTKLSYFGYETDEAVHSIIVILFLQELLDGYLGSMGKEEYKDIINCISNITGTSCILPFMGKSNIHTIIDSL